MMMTMKNGMPLTLSRLQVAVGSLLVLILCGTGSTAAFYDDQPEVTVLSDWQSFEGAVMQSDSLWMVQFCKYSGASNDDDDDDDCQKMAEPYGKLAKMMKHILFLGVVDTNSEGGQEIAKQLDISLQEQDEPVGIYWFLDEKKKFQKAKDLINMETMLGGGMQMIAQVVSERARGLGIGVDFGYEKQKQQAGASGGKKKKDTKKEGPSATVIINGEAEFEQKVTLNPLVTMIAFTAPWCGHCKMMKEDWDEAANKLVGQGAQLVWIDATDPANKDIAATFQVEGFPTIIIFPGGAPKEGPSARQYPGERKARDIVQFVLAEVDRTGIAREIPELINEAVLKAECKGQNHICVLAALPHILESKAEHRNNYKDLITKVSKNFRGGAFSFLWFEGGSQPTLETSLELTFGFPALVAYSMDRHAFAVMRGSFSEKAMSSFLHGVTSGRVPVAKLKKEKVPKIEAVEPWDGQDAAAPEEEFDLADIMGSSDDEADDAKTEL